MTFTLECKTHPKPPEGLQNSLLTAMVKTRSKNSTELDYNSRSVRLEKPKDPSYIPQTVTKSACYEVRCANWNYKGTRTRAGQGFQSFGSLCLGSSVKLYRGNTCSGLASARTISRCNLEGWQTTTRQGKDNNGRCNTARLRQSERVEAGHPQNKNPRSGCGRGLCNLNWQVQVTRLHRVWSSALCTRPYSVYLEVRPCL
jgi:hypothetical protein